ncbi:MAG: disulfide bond formation protein B [Alphaproteobacteria bacterium]|nr:disulfide bond formation protein B [Alphaproteobacteria bacterium]
MLFSQKINRLLIVLFFLISLCFSLGAEYVFEIKPCILCLYLRYVYVAILITAGVFYFYPKRYIFLIKLVLIFGAISLSFYHLGVERHWWEGPAVCSGESINSSKLQGLTADEKAERLLQHFQGKPSVQCNQVNWRIIGVSVTLWNTILLVLLFISIGFLWNRKKISTE